MTVLHVGADPEVFVRDIKSGEVLSAIGLLGGTKDKPRPVDKGALQEDNVLAEFNINPAKTREEFYVNIRTVMNQMGNELVHHGLEPYVIASHEYKKRYLKAQGGQAMNFGCDPDFNAWSNGTQNEKPSAYTTLRSAGGHIHISYDSPSDARSFAIVRAYEVFAGLKNLFRDKDLRRRELYGQSGACRIKPYGVEIRSPSNFWLETEESIKETFDDALKAEANADIVDSLLERMGIKPEQVQEAINTSNLRLARDIMDTLAIA